MELSYRGLTFERRTLSLLRELSMDAECFRRTRLGSTDREGHPEEYTLLCDQTNEELNLHRIEDVALSKELMFTYQRERSIVEAEVSPQAAARDNHKD